MKPYFTKKEVRNMYLKVIGQTIIFLLLVISYDSFIARTIQAFLGATTLTAFVMTVSLTIDWVKYDMK